MRLRRIPSANLEWDPCANNIRVIRVITSLRSVVLRRISCSRNCERPAANKDPCDLWDPCAKKIFVLSEYSCSKNTEWHPCSKISCSPCERPAANKDPWDRWDPCAKKYSCHSRNSCSKKFMVISVFKNLVFKTSCESIEIHHWSIPHCGQPQQFNIQHSKVKIALRASVCK